MRTTSAAQSLLRFAAPSRCPRTSLGRSSHINLLKPNLALDAPDMSDNTQTRSAKSILVVDDQVDNLLLVTRYLAKLRLRDTHCGERRRSARKDHGRTA